MNKKEIVKRLANTRLDSHERETLNQLLHYLIAEGLTHTSSNSSNSNSSNTHSKNASRELREINSTGPAANVGRRSSSKVQRCRLRIANLQKYLNYASRVHTQEIFLHCYNITNLS